MAYPRSFMLAIVLGLALLVVVPCAVAADALWADEAQYPARGLAAGITRGEDGHAMYEGHYVNGIYDPVEGGDFTQQFADDDNKRFIPEDSVWLQAVYTDGELTGFSALSEESFNTLTALARGDDPMELERRAAMLESCEAFGLTDGQYNGSGHVIGILDTVGDFLSLSMKVDSDDAYYRGEDQMGNAYLYLIAEYDGDMMTGFRSVEPEDFDEAYRAFLEMRKGDR